MLKSILILDPPHHSVDDLADAFRSVASPGCSVQSFQSGEKLLQHFRNGPLEQLALVHGRRGDGIYAGRKLIAVLREAAHASPIVAFADHGDVDSTFDAITAGANDFLVRGPKLEERAKTLLGKLRNLLDVLDRATILGARNTSLEEEIQARSRIVGESPEILAMIKRIKRLKELPRPILIVGERGTGKELVARALHDGKGSDSRPIVTVNCAAFSDSLLESELFGHEKGAFTGADEARPGKFEQADGGTLFLDEVGHMSLPFQQKILRVVEYGSFTRVGGHEEKNSSVRIVSATNADLKQKIRQGEFLNDLYDRLAFEIIEVPPLRARQGDIQVLAQYFLEQFAIEIPTFRGKELAEASLQVLRQHSFPGNVRELKNIIERAAYRDITNEITPEDIGMLHVDETAEHIGSFQDRVDSFSKRLLREAMRKNDNVQTEAARSLELTYDQFRYYRKKYEMSE